MILKSIERNVSGSTYQYKFDNYSLRLKHPFLLKIGQNYSWWEIVKLQFYMASGLIIFLLFFLSFILRPLQSILINLIINLILILSLKVRTKYRKNYISIFNNKVKCIDANIKNKRQRDESTSYEYQVCYIYNLKKYEPLDFFQFSDTNDTELKEEGKVPIFEFSDIKDTELHKGDKVTVYINTDYPEICKNRKYRKLNPTSIKLQYVAVHLVINLILFYPLYKDLFQ